MRAEAFAAAIDAWAKGLTGPVTDGNDNVILPTFYEITEEQVAQAIRLMWTKVEE